jgi:CO dehydrogenase/acetyl-CoA synthase beta subunit
MSFETAALQFIRKRRGQDIASERRERYLEMLKEYDKIKYGPTVNGVRVEREVNEESIQLNERRKKAAAAKKAAKQSVEIPDLDDIVGIVDLDLGS